jgi:hypothetical protein
MIMNIGKFAPFLDHIKCNYNKPESLEIYVPIQFRCGDMFEIYIRTVCNGNYHPILTFNDESLTTTFHVEKNKKHEDDDFIVFSIPYREDLLKNIDLVFDLAKDWIEKTGWYDFLKHVKDHQIMDEIKRVDDLKRITS